MNAFEVTVSIIYQSQLCVADKNARMPNEEYIAIFMRGEKVKFGT